MKNLKFPFTSAAFLRSNKIEIYSSLSDKFGSKYGVPSVEAEGEEVMKFQLDRLFTFIHDN